MSPREIFFALTELAVCSLICNGQLVEPGIAESMRQNTPMSALGYVSSTEMVLAKVVRKHNDVREALGSPTIVPRANLSVRLQIKHRSIASDAGYAGPSDPTDPKRPLICNPAIRKAMDIAWSSSVLAAHRPPSSLNDKVEFGFAVDASKDGRTVEVKSLRTSNFTDQKLNELHIAIDENTLATVHTHNIGASPVPSMADMKGPVPTFVKSQFYIYVTIPGEDRFARVEPDGVCKPNEEVSAAKF